MLGAKSINTCVVIMLIFGIIISRDYASDIIACVSLWVAFYPCDGTSLLLVYPLFEPRCDGTSLLLAPRRPLIITREDN